MFEIMSKVFWFGGVRTEITSTIVIESADDWNSYTIVHHRLTDGSFVYQVGTVTDGRFFGLVTSRDSGRAYSQLQRLTS